MGFVNDAVGHNIQGRKPVRCGVKAVRCGEPVGCGEVRTASVA